MSILCYHGVEPGWRSPLALSPESFAQQAAWLKARRRVLPLDDAVRVLDRSFQLPRGVASLTFDDGFAGLFTHALPVLQRLRLPATVFLVAETLQPGGRSVDWVDTPPAEPLRTLSVEQVLAMQEAGISFGSHSFQHRDLTELSDEECLRDLRQSRELLEDLLLRPVPFLAYPRGRHDERVRRAAEEAGFTHAFALPESRESIGPYAVPRVGVWAHNGLGMVRMKTSRWYLALRTGRLYGVFRHAKSSRRHPQPMSVAGGK